MTLLQSFDLGCGLSFLAVGGGFFGRGEFWHGVAFTLAGVILVRISLNGKGRR